MNFGKSSPNSRLNNFCFDFFDKKVKPDQPLCTNFQVGGCTGGFLKYQKNSKLPYKSILYVYSQVHELINTIKKLLQNAIFVKVHCETLPALWVDSIVHDSSMIQSKGEICYLLDSQLLLVGGRGRVFWFQLLDSLDEVRLLEAPVARLVPVVEDLFQVSHFKLLEVNRIKVDLFVYGGMRIVRMTWSQSRL